MVMSFVVMGFIVSLSIVMGCLGCFDSPSPSSGVGKHFS
jgi:hypothetical protein